MVQLEGFKEITVCNVLRGYYSINDRGEIVNNVTKRKLKTKRDKDGYLCLSLCTNEIVSGNEHKRKMFRIAGLVLREFHGDPPTSMCSPTVDHADGNKTNNCITNLRWMERSLNSSTRKNRPIGTKNGSAKLTEKEVSEIKLLLKIGNLSLRQIGKKYGVPKSTVNNIKRNKTWTFVQSAERIDCEV